jgi:hypothetical protein
MARGALRSRRARSNATGDPRSPSERFGRVLEPNGEALVGADVVEIRENGAYAVPDPIVQRQNHGET